MVNPIILVRAFSLPIEGERKTRLWHIGGISEKRAISRFTHMPMNKRFAAFFTKRTKSRLSKKGAFYAFLKNALLKSKPTNMNHVIFYKVSL